MNTKRVLSTLVLVAWLAWPAAVRAEEPSFRDLVRKYVHLKTVGSPTQPLPGLPEDIQKIVALEYEVLLMENGEERTVDPAKHEFQIDDQIRVRIRSLSDLYIYIFYEGAGGERKCLLPDPDFKDSSPLAKSDQLLRLPADDTAFTFVHPAGEDKLIVVATEEPSDDLAALSDVVFKSPDEPLTPEQEELQKKLKVRNEMVLKSIRERQAKGTRYRGLFDDDSIEQVALEIDRQGTTRAILEEPPHEGETSTFAMAATFKEDNPAELFVSIPLTSVSKGKR